MSQPPPERPAAPPRSTHAGDAVIAFSVRIGQAVLAPSTTHAALREAIERSNRSFRLAGLADRLNPDIIDADKAAALIAALPAIAQRSPRLLAGRELYLSHGGLKIGAADPTLLAGFAQPFDLEVADIQGQTLLARATVPVVARIASERASEAKAQLAVENERIAPLESRLRASAAAPVEQQRAILDELTPAQWRRSALARVWWANARETSARAGADAAAQAETEAALKAVNAYVLPTGSGMPR